MQLRSLRVGSRLTLEFGAILAILVAMIVTTMLLSAANKNRRPTPLETADKRATPVYGQCIDATYSDTEIGEHFSA